MKRIVIIGGGPAGMMAGIFAKDTNTKVVLVEKNEKLGKKLYITGKGRCNVTNETDLYGFMDNVVTNPKFLFASVSSFLPQDTISFFENNGLKLKTERGKRVFPLSDKASDVTKTLENALNKLGVEILTGTTVKSIICRDGEIKGVLTDKGEIQADKVIVCTGGVSYSLTGSTGDGYKFAKQFGHSIVPPKSALSGIETANLPLKDLQGLSLKNVKLTAKSNEKIVYSCMGEALFTHFGVSGPIVLSCSSVINKLDLKNVKLFIDFKPALDETTLDNRLIRDFANDNNKNFQTVLRGLVPRNLVAEIIRRTSVSPVKKCCQITIQERKKIVSVLKNFEIIIKGLRDIEEAIVTSGGINVKEINPKTMESKLIKGLFFAGEVIDVDAFTGGFNVQIAFSTGFLAGKSAKEI